MVLLSDTVLSKLYYVIILSHARHTIVVILSYTLLPKVSWSCVLCLSIAAMELRIVSKYSVQV